MDLKIIGMLFLTLGCVQVSATGYLIADSAAPYLIIISDHRPAVMFCVGQFFEDRRCRCVCPNPAAVLNTTSSRQIFTGNVPPRLCHCEGVVFPLLKAELEGKLHIFCPRCECIYQTRNTSLIMGIVFFILMGIILSVLYMMSYSGLKMFVMRARNYRNVNRHLERPPERDYIREHRGEFQRERQRELEQKRRIEQREREREREINRYRNRAVRDGSPGSEEETLLRAEEPEN